MNEPVRTAFVARSILTRLETLIGLAVVGTLAVLLGLTTLTMSGSTSEEREIEYTQRGEFSYTAQTPQDSVYGPEGLATGEPIVGDVAGPVTARFDYQFDTDADAEVQGTAGMNAIVTLASGLTRTFPVVVDADFRGQQVTMRGTLRIGAITDYIAEASSVAGDSGYSPASVRLVPHVEVDGTLDGRTLEALYAPELTFSQQGSTLTPADAIAEESTADPLKPRATGSVEYAATVDNTVPMPILDPPVRPTMISAFVVAAVCLLLVLLLSRPLFSGGAGGEAERISALYGSLLVEVRGLSTSQAPIADVAGIEALIDVAKKYEAVVMHVTGDHGDDYLVWDSGMVYRYRSLHGSEGRTARSDRGGVSDGAEPLLHEATRWKRRTRR